ncbi:carbon starvation protein A [bacterium]|nr:carbon starvation protein A [bacterium]
MSSSIIIIFAVVVFTAGYIFYGGYLARKFKLDKLRETPAHTMQDNIDYVPARWPVLFGHHFASIAGAAPIIGPVTAAVFGWVPVLLWILIGSVFLGAVHDFTSLVASVRHKSKSIGKVIEEYIGHTGKQLFLIFAWSTLILVIAAFVILVAKTFIATPEVATSSGLFLVLAIAFGFGVYRANVHLGIATLIGVALLIFCIWMGLAFPATLSSNGQTAQQGWTWIILAYIFVASVTPVWILLQPRDYLNSFMLYMILIAAFAGILVKNPAVHMPAFTGFVRPGMGSMFPILFVTVACGAISGFHSLVASGTTAKQLDKEPDARKIGYGAMLVEGLLAVIALIAAVTLLPAQYKEFFPVGGKANPIGLFATSVGGFMSALGIPQKAAITFAAMAISAFALTSLDTATRLGRFIFQEFFKSDHDSKARSVLTNRFVATFFTVIPGGLLALTGQYQAIWPIFGSANQLLAALALLAGSVWLAKLKEKNTFLVIPMLFMFAVTLSALVVLIVSKVKIIFRFFSMGEHPAQMGIMGTAFLLFIAVLLFIVAIILVVQAAKSLKRS